MSAWSKDRWGTWHTGPGGPEICPQGDGWHTTDEAAKLNERVSEYQRAVAWARNKLWLGKENR